MEQSTSDSGIHMMRSKKIIHIVKRRGHLQRFDERKVYATCYAACLASHIQREKAKKICETVMKGIKGWIRPKKIVTSDQIFKETAKLLAKQNRDAAFMYKTHRDIA